MRVISVVLSAAAILATVLGTLAKHGGSGSGGDDDDASSPSPSSSVPAQTPSPSALPFQFLPPGNTTTCQSMALGWQSTLAVSMTLTVTNDRATSSSAGDSNQAALVSRTLTTNVSASANQFMWTPVDVPQGTYVIVAFDTAHAANVSAESLPFFVQTGQDSSCLSAATATTSTSASPSGSATPASGANASSGDPNAPQPKKLSPAVLGGVVAGVVVGVILLILVFTFPHYWKDALMRRHRNRRPGGPYYLF